MRPAPASCVVARVPPHPLSLLVSHAPHGALLAYHTISDIVILDAELTVEALLSTEAPIVALALSGLYGVAALVRGRVLIFQTSGGEWKRVGTVDGVDVSAMSVVWRAAGELLVGKCLYRATQGLWSVAWSLPVAHESIARAAFSPDGDCLCTISRASRCAKVWSSLGALPSFVYLPHPAAVLQPEWRSSHGRRFLLTTCADGNARLWAESSSVTLTMMLCHVFPTSQVAWLARPLAPAPLAQTQIQLVPADTLSARMAASLLCVGTDEWLVSHTEARIQLHRVPDTPLAVRPKLVLAATCELDGSHKHTLSTLISAILLPSSAGGTLDARVYRLDRTSLSVEQMRHQVSDETLSVNAVLQHEGHAAPVSQLVAHTSLPLLASLDEAHAALLWRTHLPALPSAHAPLSPIARLPSYALALAWMHDRALLAVLSPSVGTDVGHTQVTLYEVPVPAPGLQHLGDLHSCASITLPLPVIPLIAALSPTLLCVATHTSSQLLLLSLTANPTMTISVSISSSISLPSPLSCLYAPPPSSNAPVVLATGHKDGQLMLWQLNTSDNKPSLERHTSLSVSSHPLTSVVCTIHRIAALCPVTGLRVFENEVSPTQLWLPEAVTSPTSSISSDKDNTLLPYVIPGAALPSLLVTSGNGRVRLYSLRGASSIAPFTLTWTPHSSFGALPCASAVTCAQVQHGWLLVACGSELLVCAPWATEGTTRLASPSLPLPWYHPLHLSELLLSGNLQHALLLLRHLHVALASARGSLASLAPLAPSVFTEGRLPVSYTPASAPPHVRSMFDDDVIGMGSNDSNASTDEAVLAGVEEALSTRVRLEALSRTEQRELHDAVRAAQQVQRLQRALDAAGTRVLAGRVLHGVSAPLGPEQWFMALLSDAHALLLEQLLPAAPSQVEWATLKALGVAYWCTELPLVRALVERLAKSVFAARRQANEVALYYVALGKRSALAALYRAAKDERLAGFFAQEFATSEKARVAAHKNAFVLLSQGRLELAAAFFLVAGAPRDALSALLRPTGVPPDLQLALLIARLADADPTAVTANAAAVVTQTHVAFVLTQHMLPSATDAWSTALAHTLVGDKRAALTALLAVSAPASTPTSPAYQAHNATYGAPSLLFACRQMKQHLSADEDSGLAQRAASAYMHASTPLLVLLLARTVPAGLLTRASHAFVLGELLATSPALTGSRLTALLTQGAHVPSAHELRALGWTAALAVSVARQSSDDKDKAICVQHTSDAMAHLASMPASFKLLTRLGASLVRILLLPAEAQVLAASRMCAPACDTACAVALSTSRLTRALAAHHWAAAQRLLAGEWRIGGDEQEEEEEEEEETQVEGSDMWVVWCVVRVAACAMQERVKRLSMHNEHDMRIASIAEQALATLGPHSHTVETDLTRPDLSAAITRLGPSAQLLYSAAIAMCPAPVPASPVPLSPQAFVSKERREGVEAWSSGEELMREANQLLHTFALSAPSTSRLVLVAASERTLHEASSANFGTGSDNCVSGANASGELMRGLTRPLAAQCLDAHPSAALYAVGGVDGSLVVCRWQIAAPVAQLRAAQATTSAQAVRWSTHSSRIATAERNGSVCVWRADTSLACTSPLAEALSGSARTPLACLAAHSERALDVCFMSASLIASCGTGKRALALWDLLVPPHRALSATLAAPETGVACIAVDSTHALLYAGCKDGALLLYDLRMHKQLTSVTAHTRSVKSMDMALDGTLATGGSDGTLRLWERTGANFALRCTATWEGAHKEHTFVRPSYTGVFHNAVATYGITHVRFRSASPLSSNLSLLSCGADGRLVQRSLLA